MTTSEAGRKLAEAGRTMLEGGLTWGNAGNLSVRLDEAHLSLIHI